MSNNKYGVPKFYDQAMMEGAYKNDIIKNILMNTQK